MSNSSPRLIVKNGNLIDGSGRDPIPNALVIIEGNRITRAGSADGSTPQGRPNDTIIDAAGKFILPGLIDAHCHHLVASGRAAWRQIHIER
jgi:imidazolonepropionase-like amidohydrolase